MHADHQRRRSYSVSGGQPCDNYRRSNPRRGHSSRRSGLWSRDEAASPPKWELEGRKIEKRRRRDRSSTPRSSSPHSRLGDEFSHSAMSSVPSFACTPADFNLFPRHNHQTRRRPSNGFESIDADMDESRDLEAARLSSLRSYAFWELHTSIAENGEDFVQRMRNYENSRSRSNAHQKAKEAQKRGRKRSGIASHRKQMSQSLRPPLVEDDDSDDDILVLAADFSARPTAKSSCHKKRHLSADGMAYDRDSPLFTNNPRPLFLYSDDGCLQGQTLPGSSSSNAGESWSSSSPLLSENAMSDVSLESEASTPFSFTPPPLMPGSSTMSSHSEKAIAALSLAMANGAVGLTDYQALLAIQETPVIDACQVGEMFD